MTLAPDLARLAAVHGVATEYKDQLERTVHVAAASVVAVLDAMGVDASTPAAIADALRAHDARPRTPSFVVMRQSQRRVLDVSGPVALSL